MTAGHRLSGVNRLRIIRQSVKKVPKDEYVILF